MKIADLMSESGVPFGTSGVRGLSDHITDRVAYAYTTAFLQYLNLEEEDRMLVVAGDLRPSTPRIKNAVMLAAEEFGYYVVDCGLIPSPAVALYGFRTGVPSVMVTGSHIPADRNGIKFTKPSGEISKIDEQGIKAQDVDIPEQYFNENGNLLEELDDFSQNDEPYYSYIERYTGAFPKNLLEGRKIGVFEHSAVGRDIMIEIVKRLGGVPVSLGRSKDFVPVDTEAIRPEDIESAAKWAKENDLFAIISTDGDSDRPLISDENGKWLRGDVTGILTAQFLNADCVVTPVSCNSAVEQAGFKKVIRTRIGSPYVIEGMNKASEEGFSRVVGYEANGGFLIHDDLKIESGELRALPTRDPIIVHLAILSLAIKQGVKVSQLLEKLPSIYTASDRLKEFPVSQSKAVIEKLSAPNGGKYEEAEKYFLSICGEINNVGFKDGMRIRFVNGEVIHLRPSGNAPEFRCYTEASSEARANEILQLVLPIMQSWR